MYADYIGRVQIQFEVVDMSSSVVDNAQLNIVLYGLSFSSPNLGCGALAYDSGHY